MSKIVVANYSTSTHFKIPKGIDLEDKTQVKWWGTKWLILHIVFVDKTREPLEIEAEFDPELDCKYAGRETIEDRCDYGYDEEEEEEDEKPTAKSIIGDIINKIVVEAN